MRFGEVLDAEASSTEANLRSAAARDVYILKGEGRGRGAGSRTFTPLTGSAIRGRLGLAGRRLRRRTLEGLVAHTDLALTGTLRASATLSIKILAQRPFRASAPTSLACRPIARSVTNSSAGWAMPVFWPAAAYNMDIEAYTARVMGDVRRDQTKAGGFPDVIHPFMPGLTVCPRPAGRMRT